MCDFLHATALTRNRWNNVLDIIRWQISFQVHGLNHSLDSESQAETENNC
jgi:hypothetical protein